MNEPLVTDPSSNEEAYFCVMADEYFSAMRKLNEKMACDQKEIEQLRDETRAIIARTGQGRLNVETILRCGSADGGNYLK